MRKLLFASLFVATLLLTEVVLGGDSSYRLAGIVAPSEADMMAMIETPDGKQVLVRRGDVVGDAEVLEITLTSVLLDFANGAEQLELAGAHRAIVSLIDKGILASEFRQRIENTPDLQESEKLLGLADMQHLSNEARVIAVNGQMVSDPEGAISALRDALDEGRQIRVTLTGDPSLPVIYLGSGDADHEITR